MEKTINIYNQILSKLEVYDLKYKEGYLGKRSTDIINHYDHSLIFFERILAGHYKQEKIIEIIELIKKQKHILNDLVKDIKNPLLLGVTGVGNCGKSSFINSILKKEVTEVNNRAETWLINILSYTKNSDENGDGYIFYEGKTAAFKTRKEIDECIEKEDTLFNASLKKIKKLRYALKEEDLSRRIKKEKSKEIKKKYTYKSDLYKINRFYSIDLLKKYRLADTPGLGQANKSKIKDVLEYYKTADGLVFVVDVDRIDQEQTRRAIERVRKNSSIKTEILLIINKVDNLKDFQVVEDKARKNYKDLVDLVLPYSAKMVVKGHETNDEELLESYNYYRALDFLNKVYQGNMLSRINKKNESINRILEESREDLTNKKNHMIKKVDEYHNNIAIINDHIKNLSMSTTNSISPKFSLYNQEISKLIERKVRGRLSTQQLTSMNKEYIDQLRKNLSHLIQSKKMKVKGEIKNLINESYISDYQWLNNEVSLEEGEIENVFKNTESILKNITFDTYEKNFIVKAKEKVGKGILGIFKKESRVKDFANSLASTSEKEIKQKIKNEKRKIKRVLDQENEKIKSQVREEINQFKNNIYQSIRDDFNKNYLVPENIKIIIIRIDKLIETLALDIITLNIVEILKKEEII